MKTKRVEALLKADSNFSNLSDCYIIKNNPEQRLNWRKFSSTEELRICLFNLAYKLKDPYAISKWLSNEGFSNTSTHQKSSGELLSYGTGGAGIIIVSDWSAKRKPFPFSTFPLWPWSIRSGFGAYGLTVTFYLSQDGSPLHVDAMFSFK